MFNHSTLRVGVILLLVLLAIPTFAQKNNNPWQDISEFTLNKSSADRQIIPEKYRTVSLQEETLKEILSIAPLHHTPEAETSEVRLSLPMPDGTTEEFRIVDAPIMAPGLAAKYPAIHAYAGQGVDDPTAYVRFGVTQKGFHAMILSARHSTVFIDAYAKNDTENYISYYRNDYAKRAEDDFACHTEGETKQKSTQKTVSENLFKAGGDCQLRTYRLALACTQEYATFHGGTIASVLAEYNIAMVRVNGVYETDFAVTMTLIDNTDEIIYLSEPDPYTNNNGGTMLGQNQTTCDNEIGSGNYDIGHVFSTGGGGIAGLGVPCRNNQKARGVTGLGSPINDPFYIDYVAHEMGHQFGANHTQNNSCNRNSATAMEPGSASTIMGYAGICAPNVQSNSDPYFHAVSMGEVYDYITVGAGAGCPLVVNNPNAAPTVTVENTNYSIPGSTPFQLTATATDPDGGTLTYCWEQMDNEISTQAPLGTNTGGPSFRSLNPTESPTRYFPSIDNIINGTNDTWEVLPTVTRDMDFRCVVRDNNMGEGCTDEVDVSISVDGNSGPFLVTNPNTNVTWMVGENQNVTWDVANTNQAPVSCANVDILLSLDGGNTYTITLATSVPNTGSFIAAVPNNITTTARVKVICSDNIFFDISNQDFVIDEPAEPTFILAASPSTVSACNDATAAYTFDFTSLAGFSEAINLSTSGLPAGATADFSTNPITPSGTSTLTISNLGGAAAGDYTITVNANSASINNSTTVVLSLSAGIPQVQNLTSPANNETGVGVFAGLSWTAVSGATNYNVIVSSSPDFATGTIIFNGDATENTVTTSALNEETVYYWQVNATSDCGTGSYSASSAFQTGAIACETYSSTDVPINIPDNDTGEVSSTLEIPAGTSFSDVDVNIFINHTWVGDLGAVLTSPSGISVTLFSEPGVPAEDFGCNGDDINVTLDDDATNTAEDFENECGGTTPTISGNYQPIDALSVFNGEPAGGTWTLTVSDIFGEDGGQINSWSIFGCSADSAAPVAPTINSNTLNTPQGGTDVVTTTLLQASAQNNTPAQLTFTLLTLPANGSLILNGMTLIVGATFTQADIDSGILSYVHNGSATTTDSFNYSVITIQGGWLPEATFNINIVQNNLAASASQQMEIACNGDTNGSITVSSTGGNAPLSYSIDGVNFQASNVFTGLGAGNYTVTVRDNFSFETTTNTVNLSNPAEITVMNIIANDMITVNANGGTGTLTYSIDGINYQPSNVFTGLTNGTYSVCVKDANDCETCENEIIAVNNVSASAAITTEISCANENDGVITVTATGGNEPYTYSINGGTPQGSNVFSFLASNDYTITVQDNDGFTVSTNTVTLVNPDQLISTPSVSDSDVTVNANGGTGTLMYSSDGGMNYQASNTFTGLANGSYTICTQDANECTVCDNVVIAVNMMVVNAVLTNDISCNNEDDGTITVNAAGGIEPYTYSLNGGTPQNSNIFSSLSADTYTITVQDDDGFTIMTNSVTVSNPLEISSSNAVTGDEITVTASGGTGNLAYTIDGLTYQSSNVFSGIANGSYDVCVRDENDCEVCSTAIIAVNGLAVNSTLTNGVSCNNGSDASITVSAAGGNEPYSYTLNGTGTPQSSNVFEALSPGMYFVEVTDNDGFVLETNTVTITNPTLVTAMADIVDFTVTINADGGTPNYQYSTNGIDYVNNNIFIFDENGTYTLFVQDANGCITSVDALVGVNQINISATVQAELACNSDQDACISVSVFNAIAPIEYEVDGVIQMDNGVFCDLAAGNYTANITDAAGFMASTEITISNPQVLTFDYVIDCNLLTTSVGGGTGDLVITLDDIVIEPEINLLNGEYVLQVEDMNGCTISDEIVINNIEEANVVVDNVTCIGDEDGVLTINFVAGGTPEYEYSLNGGDFQDSQIFEDLAPDTYEITVRDAEGCETITTAIIGEPNELTATSTTNGSTLTVTASGGTGDLSYSIDGVNFQDSNIFLDLPVGIYTITIQDGSGCSTTVETEILSGINDEFFDLDFAVNPNPNNGTFNLLVNMPTEGDLIVRVFDVAGKEIFRNVYVKNGNFFSQNISLTQLAAGSYFITVNDGNLAGTKEIVVIK